MKADPPITTGRAIVGNVFWNLAGLTLPLAIALWAIPVLIRQMGPDRFGLLSIIWMGVGYFSLFDLGIGRALTKLVAERLGRRDTEALAELVATGRRLMLALGLIAAAVVAFLAPWLVDSVLNVPMGLRTEARWSLVTLGAALPFVISSAGTVGILQAHHRFRVITSVRVPLGAIGFAGPALLSFLTPSLIGSTLLLALSRAAAWGAFEYHCRPKAMPSISGGRFSGGQVRALLGFGGWLTVSSIIGPIMVYFDRFVIGSLISMAAVAYYTTPYEVVTRMGIVADAVSGVLFPVFSAALTHDQARARMLFSGAARMLLLGMTAPFGLVLLFAPEALALWLGPDFAARSAPVMRWLALGAFANCLARLALVSVQGGGRPDLTAKAHLVEMPIYLALLWWATTHFGIVGAAAAWTARMFIDAAILFVTGATVCQPLRAPMLRVLAATVGVGLVLSVLTFVPAGWPKAICGIVLAGAAGSSALMQLAALRRVR